MAAAGSLRIALHQTDSVVGDIDGNTERFVAALRAAEAAGCDLVAGPELALTGYPPEDLLLKPGVVAANLAALAAIAERTERCAALVGFVDVVGTSVDGAVAAALGVGRVAREAAMRGAPRRLRNALACCGGGRVLAVAHKRLLPNYGVFDEERWFAPGIGPLSLVEVGGIPVGMSVCEDLWFPDGPVPRLGRGGAQLIVNVNASPFAARREAERLAVLRERAATAGCPIAYVNQVGGQDELVFDGGSLVVAPDGAVLAAAPRFAEDLLVVDVVVPGGRSAPTLSIAARVPGAGERPARPEAPAACRAQAGGPVAPGLLGPLAPLLPAEREAAGAHGEPEACQVSGAQVPGAQVPGTKVEPGTCGDSDEEAEVYAALVLGTRDYLAKNGFGDAVIGLSGGIDSSLVAAVAVDALGPARVHGVAMPSRYSSEASLADARSLATALGMSLDVVPIEPAHHALAGMLSDVGVAAEGLTDENLQSRIRGVVLMAVSNARGWLVLTTGNKSELATGYSTLYGDTAGGFAVIKDVPKTLVYRLCRHRNRLAGTDLVPTSVLDKPPSAELRPGQRDDQSLPPYEVLDPVLAALVEEDRPLGEVVAGGVDAELVARVARLVDLAEHKRRQSPLGIRITPRAFGKDRRMPITHRFREPLAEVPTSRSDR